MIAQVLSKAPWAWITCIGLFLFLSVFLGSIAWVYRRGSREFYAELAEAPFEERGMTKS